MKFVLKPVAFMLALVFSAPVFATVSCGTTDIASSSGPFSLIPGHCITVNNGVTISIASGSVTATPVLTNNGTISSLHFHGSITDLYNYGVISSFTHFPGVTGVLENAQSNLVLSGSQSLTGTMTMPSTYRSYFTNSSSYGTVSFDHMASYSLNTFGVRMAPGQTWASGTYSNVITSDSALTIGAYESISGITYNLVTSDGGLHWNLVINAASPSRVSDATQVLGNTPAGGAATIIDATSGLSALFTNLTTDQQLSNAASQTLPLLTGGSIAAVRGAMNSVNNIIQARLDHVSGRASGDSFLGDKNVWLKPFASRADQNDRDGVAGYKADTYGVAGGVDGPLSPALRIGGAFAYASSDVSGKSADAPQSNEVSIYQLIGYGSYALDDRTDINFQANVGQNTNKGRRQIAFISSVASSNYDSETAHVGLGIGRAYALSGSTMLTPSLRVDYTWIKDKSYSETGAGLLNLNVTSRSTEALVVGIDSKLVHQVNDQTTLIANLGIGYDTINKRDAITATFAGASDAAFITYGINPSPWIGRAGIGAAYKLKNGLEITGRYDVEYRESFLNQTASANMRWAF